MNLILKTQKVLSALAFYKIPLKVYSKILLKIKDCFQFKRDLNFDTYLKDCEFNKYFFDKKNILKNNIQNLKHYLSLPSFTSINDLTGIKSIISKENIASIENNAQKLLNHQFNLLGSGEVNLKYNLNAKGFEDNRYEFKISEEKVFEIEKNVKDIASEYFDFKDTYDYKPIDWHIDFKSGYRWNSKTWYKKISYGGIKGVDIKVPWELSRFYHLIALGQAYTLSQDENYAKEFVYEITDWNLNNPPRFGVNWVCTMDVAIRACNMILGFNFFKDSALITLKFKYDFLKIIFSHGLHIIKNLEKNYFVNTNHYLSDIAGLLYIGLFFYDLKIGKKWVNFALKELKKEMKNQVYDDGVDFEGSTCYHRLVLELFFYSSYFSVKVLAVKNDSMDFKKLAVKIFGDKYVEKLYKMFNFLQKISNEETVLPQIGDNDNGRLHIFGLAGNLKVNYLLRMGAIFFNSEDLNVSKGFDEEILWLYGIRGFEKLQELKSCDYKKIESLAFNKSGSNYSVVNDKYYYK